MALIQLRTRADLRYAWTNVGETRQRRIEEAKAREEEIKQREARVAQLQAGHHDDPESPSHSPYPPSGFAPSPYGMRAGGMGLGLYGAAVSSIRDEENTRSPSVVQSRGSTPDRDFEDDNDKDDAVEADRAMDGEPKAKAKGDTSSDEKKDENKEETISPTRSFAEKLLNATLLASEPPPPPEARNPSTATKWGLSATRQAQQASKAAPKRPTPVPSRSTRQASSSLKRKADNVKPEPGNGVKRISMSQLIRMKQLPIDIAVSAARLQMGEGADEDNEEETGERVIEPETLGQIMSLVENAPENEVQNDQAEESPDRGEEDLSGQTGIVEETGQAEKGEGTGKGDVEQDDKVVGGGQAKRDGESHDGSDAKAGDGRETEGGQVTEPQPVSVDQAADLKHDEQSGDSSAKEVDALGEGQAAGSSSQETIGLDQEPRIGVSSLSEQIEIPPVNLVESLVGTEAGAERVVDERTG